MLAKAQNAPAKPPPTGILAELICGFWTSSFTPRLWP